MRATAESPRMFESDFFDAFTRTPWWTVPLFWLPGSAAFAAAGVLVGGVSVGAAVALFIAGWFSWTLAEYWLHRTFFHWKPDTSWGPRMHFMVHGVHHDWVFDKYRLVMPPAVSLILCGLFFGLWYALLGSWSWTFMGGFIFGYLIYDMVHYATHHLKLKNSWFQALKKHHLLHHHSPKHKERKFGVSTQLWDVVFRTN